MRIREVVVAFSLIFFSKADTTETSDRRKRANQDNFNILLNMYKLNPLQRSDVFKTFSNRVLLPRSDQLADLNLNAKESINEKQYRMDTKKQYGEILHYSIPNKLYKGLEDLKAESFDSGHFDNTLFLNEISYDKNRKDDEDIFENILMPTKILTKHDKDNITVELDKTNAIDLGLNVNILKKKRKYNKSRSYQNAEVILV